MSAEQESGRTRKPALVSRRDEGRRASLAQWLLTVRLRARNRRDLAVDSLERAAHVLLVTCRQWFSKTRGQAEDKATAAPADLHQGTDAHRND